MPLSGRDQRPEAFQSEILGLVEIDPNDRIAARVVFDPDDIDAAFAELDARYLVGEAAAHAQTWSVVAGTTPGSTARPPATTPDCANVDHRPLVITLGNDLATSSVWDLAPDLSHTKRRCIDSAISEQSSPCRTGTSQEGFDAEWRMIDIFMSKAT